MSLTSGIECLLRLVLRIPGFRLVFEVQQDARPVGWPAAGQASVEQLTGRLVDHLICNEPVDDHEPAEPVVPSVAGPSAEDGQPVSTSMKCTSGTDRKRWAKEAGIAVAKFVKGQIAETDASLVVRHVFGAHDNVLSSRVWVVVRGNKEEYESNPVKVTKMTGDDGLDAYIGVPRVPGALFRGFPTPGEADHFLGAYLNQRQSAS